MRRNLRRILALAGAMALAFGVSAETVDMLEVDHKLYELGYRDGACNGLLDEVTVNALRNFQLANGLEATGEPDPATVGVLLGEGAVSEADYLSGVARQYADMPALASGSQGDAVSRLQRALKDLGYFGGNSDGAYGEATESAVCRFQLANGLEATGVADSAVFLRLYAGAPVAWEDFLKSCCVSAGDSGGAVRTLQLWLKRRGYFRGACTGRYGEATQQAVRRLQTDSGLESSGDVDIDTCRALFSDVDAAALGSFTLRRGDTGAEVEAVCRDLAALGYPAHARFNMQTELALMEFQLANGLAVTGEADAATQARLRSEGAVRREGYAPGPLDMGEDEALPARMARLAASLLGQMSELDDGFGLVEYVYLKCNVGLAARDRFSAAELQPASEIAAGSVLGVETGGREICGVATSDRALIYRADSGYIVMSYLDAMQPDAVRLYSPAEAQ